ncbi:SusE domain-containing protein [Flammeovirga aprica]|uniref:SusF/SusE family outer membrane protein n=1 Tax=Flammeovirga aprica JL-4 TaxID=694437 RepID=A0A7X9RU08_9BACT|nr:SusE domain-containing protein [Flammeovirga aprica]NME68252.1 SusF/SusE family outer membrane protein [Flammeovirga aprica JL-4]
MKKSYIYLIGAISWLLMLNACSPEKELTTIKNQDTVAAPIINSPSTGESLTLVKDSASVTAVMFDWSPVDYGVSVQTNYTVTMSVAGDSSNSVELGSVTTNTLSLTHAQMNAAALGLGFKPSKSSDVEIHIAATVNYQLDTKVSESIAMSVTPYSTIFPSIYMIGASVGGWDPNKAVEIANTGNQGEFRTNAYFETSDEPYFRFFSNPDWGSGIGGPKAFPNYPTDLLQPQPGDNNDDNFSFIGATGWYDILVDQNTGTITMAPLKGEPVLYMVGDVTANGWNWNATTPILNWTGHEIWEINVDLVKDGSFRLFTRFEDWGSGFGWDIITEYDASQLKPQEGSDDPNWTFIGESGNYKVVVDQRAATITITAN